MASRIRADLDPRTESGASEVVSTEKRGRNLGQIKDSEKKILLKASLECCWNTTFNLCCFCCIWLMNRIKGTKEQQQVINP